MEQADVLVTHKTLSCVEPKKSYFLATSGNTDGFGPLVPVVKFMSNPAGSAIVDAVGALRTVLTGDQPGGKRYLVVAADEGSVPMSVVQVAN